MDTSYIALYNIHGTWLSHDVMNICGVIVG